MIWALLIISINIIVLLPVIIIGILLGIDFRTVFDVNQDIMLIEVYIFKRLRIARLNARVFADNLYIKFLRTPYRKVSWLIERFDKKSTKPNSMSNINENVGKMQDKVIAPIKIKSLRINVILGTEDAYLTSILWSAIGLLLGTFDEVVSKRLEIKNYTTHYKPHYYGNEFVFDIALRISVWEIFKIVSIFKGKKKVRSAQKV